MKKNSKFANLYLVIVFLLMYLPIGVVIVFSFNEAKLPVRFTGFSLKWYQELMGDSAMLQALVNSLILGAASCLVSAVIGTFGAVGLSRLHLKSKGILEYISILPLMIPEIILGPDGILLHVEPAIWHAYPFDRPYCILRALYTNGGESKACGDGSVP